MARETQQEQIKASDDCSFLASNNSQRGGRCARPVIGFFCLFCFFRPFLTCCAGAAGAGAAAAAAGAFGCTATAAATGVASSTHSSGSILLLQKKKTNRQRRKNQRGDALGRRPFALSVSDAPLLLLLLRFLGCRPSCCSQRDRGVETAPEGGEKLEKEERRGETEREEKTGEPKNRLKKK